MGSSGAAVLLTTLALKPAGMFQKMMTAVHTASATQGSSSSPSTRPSGDWRESVMPRGSPSTSSGGTTSASTIRRPMYSAMLCPV